MSALRNVFERASVALAVLLGLGMIGLAIKGLEAEGMAPSLDLTGVWAEDGWSRPARAAFLFATGLTALGLVRVRGPRRLIAVFLLALSSALLMTAAGALDVVGLWAGLALATAVMPLAFVAADDRKTAVRHALGVLLLGAVACGVLAASFLTLAALAGSTHLLEIGFLAVRFQDASPLALTAVRAAAVAVAMLAAWAPFHIGLPELWGEGSAPLAGWLAIVWPWAGWSVIVRLSNGLSPALDAWGFHAASAVGLLLVLGAIIPAAAALAERRAGRIFALLGVGTLSELLLAVQAHGVAADTVAGGLWGYALAWVCGGAALAGARARVGSDHLEDLAGLSQRVPRTSMALALALLLWAGLPGTFSLVVRWQLWQVAVVPEAGASPIALFAVAIGGLLRVFVVARMLRVLYLRAPDPSSQIVTPSLVTRARWWVVFLAALLLEIALGTGPPEWTAPLTAPGPVLLGG